MISAHESYAIKAAISVLDGGGTLVFPTDTVYGLATRVEDPQVIQQLFEVKGRDMNQAIAVLMGRAEDLALVAANPSPEAQKLARSFWPGALTLVVSRHERLPDILSPLPTIGVRIPDHPVALALLQASGPLAVTSANLSGQTNTCSVAEVLAQLDDRVDLVLDDGVTPGGKPSTVVDMTGEEIRILREGPISQTDLLRILQG